VIDVWFQISVILFREEGMQFYLTRSSSLVHPPCVGCVDAIFHGILQNWLILQTLSS
jgi:hypothetical protein